MEKKEILSYAKANMDSFEWGGVSSNEIHFTFEKQNACLKKVYNTLKDNPHISISPLVVADESAMIYEFVDGKVWLQDEFPQGKENAYRLGMFIGYNHQVIHKKCGILEIEDVADFFSAALSHMETCINTH